MNRIKNKFDELNKRNKKGLGIFLTAGYPNLKDSEDILLKLPNIGVDFIEIGMPFSDPMADGVVIQESYKRSLKKGHTLNCIWSPQEGQTCMQFIEKYPW